MKKFTMMMIALLCAVVTFAAGTKKQFDALPFTPAKANVQLGKQFNAKQAPAALAKKFQKAAKAMARAPKKAVAADDLVGDYQWDYETSSTTSTDLETLTTTSSSAHVTIAKSTTTEDGITISGMFANDLEASIQDDEGSDCFVIAGGQLGGTSTYGNYLIYGLFYYEGDEQDEAGWYYGNIYGYLMEDGSFEIYPWIVRVLSGGDYDGYSLTPYYVEGSTFTPVEPLTVVEAPEGLETEEYAVTARNYKDDADVGGSVYIGFDGNDVYVQGMCTFIPEAWMKGTLDGTTITFATGQYFGNYGSMYDMYLNTLMNEDVVFDYDAEAGTLTAKNEVFLTDNSSYYFDSYRTCVLKKVIEKAAMPANPEITALTEQSSYGWYLKFNVPTVDVDGNGLVTSKLSYMFYTDIEGEIAPLVFTPDTHNRLTEAMTEIPYGFTEGWDFYVGEIWLNDLYSEDWNKLGIQSIYYGGNETNATEVQWYHIKDYSVPATGDFTFDFNNMELKTSTNVTNDGDITEAVTFTEENVSLTISPKEESASNPNRFWSTTAGPQLRAYSGTLTFEVPEGSKITQVVFNHNGYWGGKNNAGNVTVDTGEITNNADAKAATWTGEAQTVIFTIGANTQINSIVVTVESKGDGPVNPDGYVYDFEDGTMQGWTTIDADGDGNTWKLAEKPQINTVNESGFSVYSESYSSDTQTALTPDNYLVSPKLKLDGSISFYACAQDGKYPAEIFGVAVSTAGNTEASDFTTVEEWTMTASRVDGPSFAPGKFRSPRKTPGAWYKYSVDLSSFEGAEGYVAIRHFDCTDNFYLVVDDITIETSWIEQPDFTISPAEGVVENLSNFAITFNNYDITVEEDANATLTNTTTSNVWTTADIEVEDNVLTFAISDGEIAEPGEYTLTITGVKTTDGAPVELSFNYTIEEPLVVVELPEGLGTETWYFSASASQSSVKNQEVAIAIDGSDIYIQGLNIDYLPEAWVKGTIEGNTATFPTGQYFGAFNYNDTDYDMFFVGYDTTTSAICDVVFTIDEEAGTMTTDNYIFIDPVKDRPSYYEYYYNVVISREIAQAPELVTLPEGVEEEDWTIDGNFNDGNGSENIVRATKVAFDGTDIYVKGIPFYFEDAWMKGTIDTETGIATFPTGQFVGEDEYGWEFMVGSEDFETLCDIEFEYDAEAKTLTQLTTYIIENGESPDKIYAYGYWSDMSIYAGSPIIIEPIEAPEGLETETYLFTANVVVNSARKVESDEGTSNVTIDFSSMDLPTSSSDSNAGDITEPYSMTFNNVTLTISEKADGTSTPNRFWSTSAGPQLRAYSGTLTFEIPEGSEITQIVFNHNGNWGGKNNAGDVTVDTGEITNNADAKAATWTGGAQTVIFTIGANTQINSIVVTVKSNSGDEPVVIEPDYSYQMQVGFDGNDVYFKGVSDDTADMWLKGTLSEDGKTVTIPANQYMGVISFWGYTFPYYFTAVGEDNVTMEDVVLNYDAENDKFTTNQTIVLHDGKQALGVPYETFTNVVITKMLDFAATPADPTFEDFVLSEQTGYSKIYASIPTKDVDGNDLMTSKLFYTIWFDKDDNEQLYTFTASLYSNDFEEDVTEIPYSHDGYDIYSGGEIIYLEETHEELSTWKKIGIQSIYYGGGECNKSNIVWFVQDVITGIADVKADDKNVVIFDLQGRRVTNATKGLYIINGKKVVIK